MRIPFLNLDVLLAAMHGTLAILINSQYLKEFITVVLNLQKNNTFWHLNKLPWLSLLDAVDAAGLNKLEPRPGKPAGSVGNNVEQYVGMYYVRVLLDLLTSKIIAYNKKSIFIYLYAN